MTDAEVICSWMEPKPSVVPRDAEERDLSGSSMFSRRGGFWICRGGYDEEYQWVPRVLTLDALWLVEGRLAGDGTLENQGRWKQYNDSLIRITNDPDDPRFLLKSLIHASAEQKVKALAAILRPIVEAA